MTCKESRACLSCGCGGAVAAAADIVVPGSVAAVPH